MVGSQEGRFQQERPWYRGCLESCWGGGLSWDNGTSVIQVGLGARLSSLGDNQQESGRPELAGAQQILTKTIDLFLRTRN